MVGNKQQQKKSSLFSMFKSRRPRRGDNGYSNAGEDSGRKIWPSDEDKGEYWVAEPGIDRKASAFIAKFYETRVSESKRHSVSESERHSVYLGNA